MHFLMQWGLTADQQQEVLAKLREKQKDAELVGVPWIVVVGRGWADGVVELRNRFTGETREIAVDNAAADISAALTS